jgi:hypothetical protein
MNNTQEPVFWYRPVAQPGGYEGPLHNSVFEKVRKESGSWKPLYTTPQQRPWVGLTEEDREKFDEDQLGWNDLLTAADAKLKEKNNG